MKTAPVLDSLIQPQEIVAVAGVRTARELVNHLPTGRSKGLTIVQTMGSVDSSVNIFDAQEVGRVMAQRLGGTFLALTTPAFILGKRRRDALLELEQVRKIHEYLGRAHAAIVGLGTLENSVFVERGVLPAKVIAELQRAGAVGELCGRFIDAQGRECDTPWRDRELDVGAGQGEQFNGCHVVLMAKIFELMRGRPERHLYTDINSVEFPRLAAEVMRYGSEKQIVIASRQVREIRAWKARVPNSETVLWLHGNEAELNHQFMGQRKTKFAGVTQVQIHVYPKQTKDAWAPSSDQSPTDNLFRLRYTFLDEVSGELPTYGIVFQTFPYTVEPSAYAKLFDLGVVSFATDHPDVSLRELEACDAAKQSSKKS